jgi:hypothetical protein
MDIAFGAAVVSQDGEETGKVALVLINPLTSLVSHVVMASESADHDKRAVPMWAIDRGEANELFLEVDTAELAQFPTFGTKKRGKPSTQQGEPLLGHEPGEFPALFPEDGSLPEEAVSLSAGATVVCREGTEAGTVMGLHADDYTAEATILYVLLAGKPAKTVAVPSAWARSIASHRVKLECAQGDLRDLPHSPLDAPESPIEPLQRG